MAASATGGDRPRSAPALTETTTDQMTVLRLSGEWNVAGIRGVDTRLREFLPQPGTAVTIVKAFDNAVSAIQMDVVEWTLRTAAADEAEQAAEARQRTAPADEQLHPS